MLPCEPPSFSDAGINDATVGGMIAAGLSGPRRPWSGSVRDFVLGTRVITGLGKHLKFGGEVMKNVAGYDLSRLMAGSFGCLGLLTEVSLKVLPKPRLCTSIALELDSYHALARLAEWGQQPLPISAASHDGRVLRLRLEGGEGSVAAAHERLGGELIEPSYWQALNEHRLDFFTDGRPLWRLSLPTNTGVLELPWGSADRLGRRATLVEIRRRRRADSRRSQRSRRSRYLLQPRSGRQSISAFDHATAALSPPVEGATRPARNLQSGPYVRGDLNHADHPERTGEKPAPRRRSRKHSAQLRALRFLQRNLPDLSTAG
jgi:hypothetical protein